ncbi:MAG: hypothetical protein ACREOG_04495 [Gemmatimonadaceae bacterium]
MIDDGSMFDAFKKVESEGEERQAPCLAPKAAEPEADNGLLVVAPVLRCSDCRLTMYKTYYAMAGRPVCAKCRAPYAKRLARGRGAAATRRALLWGFGAAFGCALVFAGVSMTLPFLRHLLAFGIAFAVTKAVMAATGNLGGRPLRYMAVAFTYGAIGLGSVLPVAVALDDDSVHAAVAQRRANDSVLASPPLGTSTQLVGEADQGADLVLDARRSIGEVAEVLEKSVYARQALAKIHVGMTPDQKHAEELVAAGGGSALAMGLLITLFFAPFVGLLTYGIFSAGVGLLLLVFSLFKAWRWTEPQIVLDLSGPHRVGEGPIPTLY